MLKKQLYKNKREKAVNFFAFGIVDYEPHIRYSFILSILGKKVETKISEFTKFMKFTAFTDLFSHSDSQQHAPPLNTRRPYGSRKNYPKVRRKAR